jgi:hypothetical protein
MTKRTTAQWQALFSNHYTSGLTAAVFCRQHKLCPKYFSLRKRQLQWGPPKAVPAAQTPSAFVPAKAIATRPQYIKLTWQSVQLSLPGNVPVQWLAQLVKALAP